MPTPRGLAVSRAKPKAACSKGSRSRRRCGLGVWSGSCEEDDPTSDKGVRFRHPRDRHGLEEDARDLLRPQDVDKYLRRDALRRVELRVRTDRLCYREREPPTGQQHTEWPQRAQAAVVCSSLSGRGPGKGHFYHAGPAQELTEASPCGRNRICLSTLVAGLIWTLL